MPTLDLYDSFGSGFNVTEDGPFIPVDPSLQIGPLTYGDTVATGSVTGNPGFNLVRITYTAIEGSSTDLQVSKVEFGTQPADKPFDPAYIISGLELIVPRATLDSGKIDWLVVDVSGNDEFFGNNFVDLVQGGTGNDSISGFGGDDTLYGEAGSDLLVGDLGDDTLDGGEGDDAVFYFGRPSEYSFYVRLDGAVEVTDNVEGGTDVVLNVETFVFEFGGELTQADLFNPVKVYAGDDTITGTNSKNVLRGYGGNDTIKALGGNDTAYGGTGNDTVYGGTGNDTVTGGTGQDHFVFDTKPSSTNKDRIVDFNVKDDTIRLENAVFKVGSNGTLKAGAFWSNNTGKAHDASDRVIYDKNSGVLYYDPDGTGSAKAVAFATISKNLSMTNKDIYVI
jgi:Ca2+-binding RTX toxin-like protein